MGRIRTASFDVSMPRLGMISVRVQGTVQRGFIGGLARSDANVALFDGRCFAPSFSMKILGVIVDNTGGTKNAYTARAEAAMGV